MLYCYYNDRKCHSLLELLLYLTDGIAVTWCAVRQKDLHIVISHDDYPYINMTFL